MDEVRKPINSVCYTPSSEPYRIYPQTTLWMKFLSVFFFIVYTLLRKYD
jgi:hypothetical protein